MKTLLSKITKNDQEGKVIKSKDDSISPILIPATYRNSNKNKSIDCISSCQSVRSPLIIPSLYAQTPLNEATIKKKNNVLLYPEVIKQLHTIKINLEAEIKRKDETIRHLEEQQKNNDIQMLLLMIKEKDNTIETVNKEKSCLEHKIEELRDVISEKDQKIATLNVTVDILSQDKTYLQNTLNLKNNPCLKNNQALTDKYTDIQYDFTFGTSVLMC